MSSCLILSDLAFCNGSAFLNGGVEITIPCTSSRDIYLPMSIG